MISTILTKVILLATEDRVMIMGTTVIMATMETMAIMEVII